MTLSFRSLAVAASLAALTTLAAAPSAEAGCVNKAGQGPGSTVESAKFQAWEAVLQATSWPMWSQWISSTQKIGTAPGYKVSNVGTKCTGAAGSYSCTMQAKLCN